MAKVIVPVGFDGGRLLDHDPDNGEVTGPGVYEVIKPSETVDLSQDEYRVWLLASSDPEASSRGEFDRSDLESVATLELADQPVDVPAVIDGLFKHGLLAEFDPDGPSGVEFLKTHRLFPTGDGLGESEESPGYFLIGRDGRVLLKLMIYPYTSWLEGPYYGSIWDQLAAFRAGSDEEPVFSEEATAQMVAHSLAGIVTSRCGFVQAS